MLILLAMKNSSEEIQKLMPKVEAYLDSTAPLQQVLAQIEATILRKECQKVSEKSKKELDYRVSRSFKP